jgi:hypothetical protein
MSSIDRHEMNKETTTSDKTIRFFYDAIKSDSKETQRQLVEDICLMIMDSSKFEKLISEKDIKINFRERYQRYIIFLNQ